MHVHKLYNTNSCRFIRDKSVYGMYVTCLNSLHVLYALFAKFIISSYSRNMILKIDDQ